MKTKLLFPHRYTRIGWIFITIAIFVYILFLVTDIKLFTHFPVFCVYDSGMPLQSASIINPIMSWKYANIRFEIITSLFVLGSIFIGFSRVKSEDEYTMKLRLESLLWAMYINFAIFLFAILFIYGFIFIWIPFLSLLAFLIIFNVRFYYVLYQSKKMASYEK